MLEVGAFWEGWRLPAGSSASFRAPTGTFSSALAVRLPSMSHKPQAPTKMYHVVDRHVMLG